ncbi:MAG: hypothetical protein FJZ01_00225 [Candidatus Sericytochromatia bacterium]|nr:hypothetical protein [Candidatus Tanganyikabacteria bacterium]
MSISTRDIVLSPEIGKELYHFLQKPATRVSDRAGEAVQRALLHAGAEQHGLGAGVAPIGVETVGVETVGVAAGLALRWARSAVLHAGRRPPGIVTFFVDSPPAGLACKD